MTSINKELLLLMNKKQITRNDINRYNIQFTYFNTKISIFGCFIKTHRALHLSKIDYISNSAYMYKWSLLIVKLHECISTWEENDSIVKIYPVMNNFLYLLKNASGITWQNNKWILDSVIRFFIYTYLSLKCKLYV